MVMDVNEGMKLVESLPEVEAFLLVRESASQFTSRRSSGMTIRAVGKDSDR